MPHHTTRTAVQVVRAALRRKGKELINAIASKASDQEIEKIFKEEDQLYFWLEELKEKEKGTWKV